VCYHRKAYPQTYRNIILFQKANGQASEIQIKIDDSNVEVLDDSNGNGDGNTTTTTNTPTHNVPKTKDVAEYLSKHINSLTTVPAGKDTYQGMA
jgi:hypothetical protein